MDSLTQKNPQLVKAVRDLVAELSRITLLWDETWLAALMQRQGEVHRRLLQIEAETKRTLSIPSHVLTPDAKDAIMRQKYVATMKPVSQFSFSLDGWLDRWTDGKMDEQVDGRTDRQTYRQTCRQIKWRDSLSRQTDRQIDTYTQCS